MTQPNPAVMHGAQSAMAKLASRQTQFIFNEWYVAAMAGEVNRTLFKRTILGRSIVFFRTQAGEAVAMDDRCAHRSYPLSASTLDGDTIVCRYHGIRYDTEGNWIEVPSQEKCPKNTGVRSYKLIEQGALIWIWMGDKTAADTAHMPTQPWMVASEWARTNGAMHLKGNYVSLHENLMDLTHLTYLHADTIGTPDYAKAQFDVVLNEHEFILRRNVVPTKLPPVWGKPTGLEGSETAARIAQSRFVAPSLHEVSVTFYESTLPAETRPEFQIKTAHLVTPETHSSTHYFILHGRNFALEDTAIGEFMHENLFAAFNEDVVGLALVEDALERADDEFYEISIGSDRASVAMRRYLKMRADSERAE